MKLLPGDPFYNTAVMNDSPFRDGTFIPKQEMNLLFSDGGLGDNICRLSVVKYIIEQCPYVNLNVWVPDYFYEITKFCFPNVNVCPFSDHHKYNDKLQGLDAGSNHQHTSIKTHLIDHAFHVIVDRQVEIEHKNYVQIDTSHLTFPNFISPDKYIVIPTGHTVAVREFPAKVVNEISDYILSKGYTPVYLGNTKANVGVGDKSITGNFNTEVDYSKGINLINQTSLLQAHQIISKAALIVGVDCGLLHLAGMTEVPIIMGFTTVESRLRLPYRKNQLGWNCYSIESPVQCFGCQSRMNLIYDHDFRNCFYKDIMCVKSLTSEMFIKEINKII